MPRKVVPQSYNYKEQKLASNFRELGAFELF